VLLVCRAADATGLQFQSNPDPGAFVDLSAYGPEVVDVSFNGAATLPLTGFQGNYLFQGPVIVGQNGAAGFGISSGELCSDNEEIPSDCAFGGAQSAILFWDDIDDEDGDVTYALLDNGEVASGAVLIIQWSFHNVEGTGSTLRFQLHIFPNAEPTGLYAKYVYRIEGPDDGAGASATIGYQDGGAGFGDIQCSHNQAGAVADGTVMSFFIPASGDLDHDGIVNVSDVLILLLAWGPCGTCGSCPADMNGDCVVNSEDLALLLGGWTQ
jgi:hypothetical protein